MRPCLVLFHANPPSPYRVRSQTKLTSWVHAQSQSPGPAKEGDYTLSTAVREHGVLVSCNPQVWLRKAGDCEFLFLSASLVYSLSIVWMEGGVERRVLCRVPTFEVGVHGCRRWWQIPRIAPSCYPFEEHMSPFTYAPSRVLPSKMKGPAGCCE